MRINEMEVEKSGQGPAVILVHGLGGTGNVWFPQTAALEKNHTVYRPDLNGAGRSPLNGELSVEGFIGDLLALMDSESLERASFVGHSFGSLIVQHLAAAHPRRVDRLALVGPVRAPAEQGRQGSRARAATVRAEGMLSVADAIVGAALCAATLQSKPVTVAFVRELLVRQPAQGYAATCEALANAHDPDYSRIQAPVLLLTGKDDGVGSPATAQALQALIKGSSLGLLDDCGHWTPVEQPEKVAAELTGFLD